MAGRRVDCSDDLAMSLRRDATLMLGGALLAAALCLAAYWFYFRHVTPKQEAAAPAVTLNDGSLVLERKPDANAKPAMQTPKGKVIRTGQVTVKPNTLDGKPINIDYAAVRDAEGVRVVTHSDQGTVMGGIDIPVEALASTRRWAAGVSYDPIHGTPGAWIDRKFDRVIVGAEFNQTRTRIGGEIGWEARLRIGFEF